MRGWRPWRATIPPLAIASLLASALARADPAPIKGTTPFLLDGNRIYAQLDFIRADGSTHRALAFVDMGSPGMAIRESLAEDLQLGQHRPLRFKVGELLISLPENQVIREPGSGSPMGPRLSVEALFPAAILQRYRVEIDYRTRTLTLSGNRARPAKGIPVPFRIDHDTGIIAVRARIDGKPYWMTLDAGSAYTWVRRSAAGVWLRSHPDWERGTGAVGPSNMMMSGDSTETAGTLLRIPAMSLGPLHLRSVGALAVGPGHLIPGNIDLLDWYSRKNPVPVVGWIGGNVLQQFRLTIDYPNRTSYWQRQIIPGSGALEQVGVTLRYENHSFAIAGVATRNGRATVTGVLPGDRLLKVDGLATDTATWGAIYHALHGKPGEMRLLTLERNGRRLVVSARVTAF